MNAEQKRAWLAVATGAVSLPAFAILTPLIGFLPASAAFALFALNGFGVFIGRREKPDERDLTIARGATLAGGMASYGVFVLALMGTWAAVYLLRGQDQVCIHVLPTIVMLGGIVLYLVRGITVLVLYRTHVEADDV